jgi:hypothetical protein
MRSVGPLSLVAFGTLLISAAIWIWRAYPLHAGDARVAFERLADVPLGQIESQGLDDVMVTVPSSAAWRRIRRSWGDPGYIIAVVAPGPKQYLYCLEKLDLRVSVAMGSQQLNLRTAEYPPYGYSVDCKPAGLQFHALEGATVRIRVARGLGGVPRPANLVVEPYWTAGAKDHLAGVALEEQFHLRAVAGFSAVAGAAMLACVLWLFARRRA